MGKRKLSSGHAAVKYSVIGLFAVFALAVAYALVSERQFRAEPKGFDGLPWSTALADVPGLAYARSEHPLGTAVDRAKAADALDVYVREPRTTAWLGCPVDEVAYLFWRGRLAAVVIRTPRGKGRVSKDLYDRIVAVHGKPMATRYDPPNGTMHIWEGMSTNMQATHMGDHWRLGYYSTALFAQREKAVGKPLKLE